MRSFFSLLVLAAMLTGLAGCGQEQTQETVPEEPLVLESFLHQTTENPITLEYLIQASGFVNVENIEFITVQLEENKDSLLSALESYGHRVYIEILYQTLLQRDADEEGLNYWQSALAGDLERSDLYDAIVTSEEYRIRIQGENP